MSDDLEVRVAARGGPGRCTFCRDAIPAAQLRVCDGCGATYHRDCLERELGACATRGCLAPVEGAAVRVAPRWNAGDRGPRVGSTRPCARCGAAFVVEQASRFNPTCPSCSRRRNAYGLLAALGLFVAYLLLVFFSR